ncbi:MAG: ABC transporter ATP-binding protein [Pirellula sp.]
MPIIKTNQLCKSYGRQIVLQNVDLVIEAGKLVGFLGPNGAGKTTTLRVLMGLLIADSGTAEVLGKDCWAHGKKLRHDVGYLPGDVHFYAGMSGLSTLKYFARIRKVNCDKEINRLADRLELPLRKSVRTYSTGMKQKLGIIQALMHKPDLLILDEPTSALDPLVRTQVFSELRSVIQQGRSVLFSSHSLDEVEELCDEVVILRDGKIVEHQKIEVLRGRALRKVEIVFANHAIGPNEFPSELQLIHRTGARMHCTWAGEVDSLLAWLHSYSLTDLLIERPDLSDLFITYYASTTDE